MIVFALAAPLIVALSTLAEASPPKSVAVKNASLARFRTVLPRDWTLELTGLPAGVEAMAFGPTTRDGRAVLIASRLADPNAALDRATLERKFGAQLVSYEKNDTFGTTELRCERRFDGTELTVAHVFGGRVGPYAISLIAPKPMFPKVYKTLLVAAERLAKEGLLLSEKVGTKR